MLTLETLRDPGTVIKNPPVGVNQNYVYRIKETGDTFEIIPEKKETFLAVFEDHCTGLKKEADARIRLLRLYAN